MCEITWNYFDHLHLLFETHYNSQDKEQNKHKIRAAFTTFTSTKRYWNSNWKTYPFQKLKPLQLLCFLLARILRFS